LLLLDDSIWHRRDSAVVERRYKIPDRLAVYAAAILIILMLPINGWNVYSAFERFPEPPRMIQRMEPLRIANGYGLFRQMTKDRKEIVIEGSSDGIDWRPYEFKWKPGDVMRAPGWCQPHQPRLDWQMWFAALGSPRERVWFSQLVVALLRGKTAVGALFEKNPFPQTPPRFIRAILFRYRFTNAEEHRQTGAWWKRQELGEYLPSVSLEDVQ
jgi:lipase maturation factor 1